MFGFVLVVLVELTDFILLLDVVSLANVGDIDVSIFLVEGESSIVGLGLVSSSSSVSSASVSTGRGGRLRVLVDVSDVADLTSESLDSGSLGTGTRGSVVGNAGSTV